MYTSFQALLFFWHASIFRILNAHIQEIISGLSFFTNLLEKYAKAYLNTSQKFTVYKQEIDYVIALNDYFRFNLIRKYLNDTSRLGYEFGYAINQTLVSCRYQDKSCSDNDFMIMVSYSIFCKFNLNRNLIFNILIAKTGMCYRFNQGINGSGDAVPLKELDKSGWRYGLQLELFTATKSTRTSS
jgi:hypothetical protein